jgi:hypothetical protein
MVHGKHLLIEHLTLLLSKGTDLHTLAMMLAFALVPHIQSSMNFFFFRFMAPPKVHPH